MATLVQTTKAQDFLVTEFDYRFCREEGVLTNGAAELAVGAGMLVKGTRGGGAFTPCETGETATGICMTDTIKGLAASGTMTVVVLNWGPAVVDAGSIFDDAGDALASAVADMAAVGIKVIPSAALLESGDPAING